MDLLKFDKGAHKRERKLITNGFLFFQKMDEEGLKKEKGTKRFWFLFACLLYMVLKCK